MLPAELLQADFIVSMPKLKTHHWAVMTGSMKNLFGGVPGAVYGWPKNLLHFRGIDNSIVDLAATVRPHLAVVVTASAFLGNLDADRIDQRGEKLERYRTEFALLEKYRDRRLGATKAAGG